MADGALEQSIGAAAVPPARRPRPTSWRRRCMAAAVLLVVSMLLPPGGHETAEAAIVPGTSAWLETLDRGNSFRLVVSGAEGDRVVAPQVYGRPAVSPDGARVAYSAPLTDGSDGRYGLFVVDADGTNRRRLTAPPIGDFDPTWSPDGRVIAFARDERGNFEASCCTLWLISADGPSYRRLANATSARHPAFAPNGANLAYTGPAGIQVVGVNGVGNRRVASGQLSWPTWSPDGQTIAAVRRTGPQSGTVSLMPFAGGSLVDTSAGSGGGLPEAPVYASQTTLLHLNVYGEGEDGRTRGEVRRTTIGGSSTTVYRKGRPMFYFGWSEGVPCTPAAGPPPPSPPVTSPMIVRFGGWHLRGALTSGPADTCFNYGQPLGDRPVTGDWDGNGTRTPGIVRGSVWHLRNTNTQGTANSSLSFGRAGDVPVVGDWDGDGTDTPGIYRANTWYLTNSVTSGVADISYRFGQAGDRPVAGDWNGDGIDTVGIVRDGTWHLANRHVEPTADIATRFGRATDVPVVGDWDGNGSDTMGVFRDGTWYLSNDNQEGTSQVSFVFGRSRDIPVVWQ